jgi:pimeloyl-ACP methyl ester carboxylesterase
VPGEGQDAIQRWQARLKPVSVDGLRTFVLDEGSGEPVVFLHGIPTQAFLWRDVADVVAREHRVIVPDLLGFGFADRPETADFGPGEQWRYLERVLDELDVARCAVVAHDYGALVAAEMMCRQPERVTRLVLTNTSVWKEDWGGGRLSPFALLKLRGLGESAFRLARPFMLTRAFRLYASDKERINQETMSVYWHPFADGFGRVLLTLARDGVMSDDDFCRWRDTLHAFPHPALVVWGDKDPTFRSDRGRAIANMLPNGYLEVFEHANHFVPEDRPAALGRLIVAFLAGRYPV